MRANRTEDQPTTRMEGQFPARVSGRPGLDGEKSVCPSEPAGTNSNDTTKRINDDEKRESNIMILNTKSLLSLLCLALACAMTQAAPVGSAFLYNGLLHHNGAPANGAFDLRFELFDDPSAGSPVGTPLTLEDVAINNGLLTVTLDFGAAVFNGSARFLEIAVHPGAETGSFNRLPTRQPVLPTPEAIHAAKADTASSVAITDLILRNLQLRGNLTFEGGRDPLMFTGTGILAFQHYLQLLDSPSVGNASGLKAGGILVSDNYAYANPARNDLIVKGNVGIGTADPRSTLDVAGNVRLSGAGQYIHCDDRLHIQSAERIYLNPLPGGGPVYVGGNGGSGNLIVAGSLTIMGGSDLSENFDIGAPEGSPEPGMVVCIDPASPGKLVLSSKAHDRTVAGIISGANGISTGMMMGQAGSVAAGKHPVALTGRVYAWADATEGPIQSGDLLTTSDTAGHCMKVTDRDAAQGAIVGKAMTALPEGKGLVLVLVSLQ